MGIKQQTTKTFKDKVYNKHGDKVEILSEYNGGTEPIDFIYHCPEHGHIKKTLNAKNIFARHFSPCRQCTSAMQSDSAKGMKPLDKEYYYNKLMEYCLSRNGTLISKQWITAKTTYEVNCGVNGHPNFYTTADSMTNGNGWCPYCSGRSGNFEADLKSIVEGKNGEILSKYELANKHMLLKCKTHNYIWSMTPTNIKKGRWCPICSIPYSEKVVYDYLINNKYIINIQHNFEDLIGENNERLKYDFSIFDKLGNLLLLLEIDDDEHRHNHTQLRRIKARERDELKDLYCIKNKINIFRLEYYNKKKLFKNYDWYYKYIEEKLGLYLSELFLKED